jgi:hypothetical protein
MVVLARSVGLPARLVNGFAGGRENPIGGFVEVTRSDAHAWVEIHFERAGWVRYDPTPPDQRLRAAAGLSLAARLWDVQSALELWWFQHVVEFDRVDQLRAMRSAWRTWRDWRRQHASETPDPEPEAGGPALAKARQVVLVTAILCAAGFAALRLFRRRARRASGATPHYADALALLARRGLVRLPHETARGFAATVAPRLPAGGATAFRALTECHLAERFGRRAMPRAGTLLRDLRDSLRA